MLNIKIVYGDKSPQKALLLNLKVNPNVELLNEDEPKEKKLAWKYKGAAGARQLPFFSAYEDGKLIKAWYSEDHSATVMNLIEWMDQYYKEHGKAGHFKISKDKGETVYEGEGYGFAEGWPLFIDKDGGGTYHTSLITSIDWENKTFNTLNSTYEFEYSEHE